MQRSGWLSFALALALAGFCGGCGLVPGTEADKLADGVGCQNSADCKSGVCTTAQLCAHSSCSCSGRACPANGEHSSDCGAAWVCVASTSIVEGVGEFFGASKDDNDGYCQLPCSAGCLEHYSCDGQYCVPDQDWAAPVPSASWSGGADGMLSGKGAMQTVPLQRGKTVSLSASASSPVSAKVTSVGWNVVADTGEQTPTSGESVDVTLPADGAFRRAELTVTDDRLRSSVLYVVFEGCSGAGEACGYQGSGCCNGCDDATTLCQ